MGAIRKGWAILRAAGLLATLAAAVEAQVIHGSYGSEEFRRAYVEGKTGEVIFEPFQRLKWEDKARAALTWLNIDEPTPAQVARMQKFESAGPLFRSVEFRAPLDPAVSGSTYLLIYSGGIIPLQPVGLKGSVDLDFERDMVTVHKALFSGSVIAKPSQPVTTAAFAIVGKPGDAKDVDAAAKFAKRTQGGEVVYDLTDAGHPVTWTPLTKEESDPSSALSFRLADKRYLLVKWTRPSCSSSYTLFSIDDTLEPIVDNDYDCDR